MSIKIFFCYAREDEVLLSKLKSHLRPLQREGLIDIWYDRDIRAGGDWEWEISEQLNAAHLILLLISPDFMDSDYCYSVEMQRALERYERGETRIIPVILRPVYWQIKPLIKLQALPKDTKPVIDRFWHSQDEAFFDVTEGIRKVVQELIIEPKGSAEDHARDTQLIAKDQQHRAVHLAAVGGSNVGRERKLNEDAFYSRIQSFENGDCGLFVVADGMGGHRAGERASQLAVTTIGHFLESFLRDLETDRTTEGLVATGITSQPSQNLFDPELVVEMKLKDAIQAANRAILDYGVKSSFSKTIGCTITAVLVYNKKAYVANVGDCRTYLFRNGELKTLTRDHSLVQRLVEAKQINPEEVYTHPQRNVIYRSLGMDHKIVEVDTFFEVLQSGDILLLCSDGLWEMVRPPALLQIISKKASLQKICDALIDYANASGGEDNISAIVVAVL